MGEPRYRLADVKTYDLGEGRGLVYSRSSKKARTFSVAEGALLRGCLSYKTLQRHASDGLLSSKREALRRLAAKSPRTLSGLIERAAQSLEPNKKKLAATLEQLRGWADDGFLVSDRDFLCEASARDVSAAPPPISSVGMTTRNRRDLLRRAMASFIDNAHAYERSGEYVVIDDSKDPSVERANREMLGELAAETGARIRWAGRHGREAYAAELSAVSGVEPEVVDFALFGDDRCRLTTGAARNSLLLDTLGGLYLLSDDDSVCRAAQCPDKHDGISVASGRDPTRFWFYRDRAERFRQARFEDVDILALHERLLGRSAAEMLSRCNDPEALDLENMSPAFERRLRERGAAVRATMGGTLGDSGVGAAAYLFIHPDSRRRISTSEEFYRAALGSRQVLRATPRETITDVTLLMAGNAAFDNRSLLPPFLPVQRNSDGIFALLLRRCFRDSCLGHPPYAVVHDPVESRTQTLEHWWRSLEGVPFHEVVRSLVDLAPEGPDESDPEREFARLGSWFVEAGALPAAEFDDLVRSRLWERALTRRLVRADEDRSEIPAFYLRLREKQLAVRREWLARNPPIAPSDLAGTGDEIEVRALTRELVVRLGRVFSAWPAIREGAAELRRRGVRLSENAAKSA